MDLESLFRIISTFAALGVPLSPGLLRSYIELRDRLLKTETLLTERMQKIGKLSKMRIADAARIAALESAQQQLKEMVRTQEQRYLEISSRLEIIPRVDEALRHLAKSAEVWVSRNEINLLHTTMDMRVAALEKRSSATEDDVSAEEHLMVNTNTLCMGAVILSLICFAILLWCLQQINAIRKSGDELQRILVLEIAKAETARVIVAEAVLQSHKESISRLESSGNLILSRLDTLPRIAIQLEALKERLDRLSNPPLPPLTPGNVNIPLPVSNE